MIKIFDQLILLPLLIIFETALRLGIYPNQWKEVNDIHIHKYDSKNLFKNYRPLSLLPIRGKIFENAFLILFIQFWNIIIYSLRINQDSCITCCGAH